MRSRINGEEIDEEITIIWAPHRSTNGITEWRDYESDGECHSCRKQFHELFQTELPISHGWVCLCYDCLIACTERMCPNIKERELCPVCGFGALLYSGTTTCIFGHEWDIKELKLPFIVKGWKTNKELYDDQEKIIKKKIEGFILAEEI